MDFPDQPVLIRGYPIPPSDNTLKMPVRRFKKGGGGKRVMSFMDSLEYIEYKSAVNIWRMKNFHQYADHIGRILIWYRARRPLGITVDFRVHHQRIFTKDGMIRRWDVTNYMKALHDTFCAITGIDDSYFFDCRQRKVEIPDSKIECLNLYIGPISVAKEHL